MQELRRSPVIQFSEDLPIFDRFQDQLELLVQIIFLSLIITALQQSFRHTHSMSVRIEERFHRPAFCDIVIEHIIIHRRRFLVIITDKLRAIIKAQPVRRLGIDLTGNRITLHLICIELQEATLVQVISRHIELILFTSAIGTY